MVFAPDLEAVGSTRRFLRSTLSSWGREQYDVNGATVLTELATNAALHARTPYQVMIALSSDHLLIEVSDANSRRPRARGYGTDATTGRGMSLVAALSADWGVRVGEKAKTVWAQVLPDEVNGMTDGFNLRDDEPVRTASPRTPPTLAPQLAPGVGTAESKARAA